MTGVQTCALPISGQVEFYKNRSRPDGFSDWCKICHKESMNKSRTKQPATKKKPAGSPAKGKPAAASRKIKAGTAKKTCAGCGNDKPADLKHFNRSNRAADKLDSLCKECRNLKKRQVRQADKFTLSIDLSDHRDLFERIQRIAEEEERTMEAQVRYWLKTGNFSGEVVV